MEIIRHVGSSVFLDGLKESSCPRVSSKQVDKGSIAFGRTIHEQTEKSPHRFVNKNGGRDEQSLPSNLHKKNVSNRLSRDEQKNKDCQQGKIRGRQIMNSNHDQRKAQEIRKRQKMYSIQVHSSRRDSASLNIDSITRVVVQGFKNLIDCERSALFLMDHTTNELFFKPLGVEHDVNCREIRFPVTSGVAGYCATSRATLNIKNAYQDPRFNPEIDKQTNFRTRTILCMPVLSSTEVVLGVIQMINKKKGDIKKILSDAKKKKSDSNFHGYESGYEEFSKGDEEILEKCCREVSKVLEPLVKSTAPSLIEELPPLPKETANDRRPSTVSRRDSRRVSIGSLVHFVNSKSENSQGEIQKPLNEVDVSITEAFLRFQFRSASGPPAKGDEDPDRAVAASRRKRMIDYGNMRRRSSISSNLETAIADTVKLL